MPRKKAKAKQRVVYLRGMKRTDSKVEQAKIMINKSVATIKSVAIKGIATIGKWRIPHGIAQNPIIKQLVQIGTNNRAVAIGTGCLILAIGITAGMMGMFNKEVSSSVKKIGEPVNQNATSVNSILYLNHDVKDAKNAPYLATDSERIAKYSKPGFDGWTIMIGNRCVGLFSDEITTATVLEKYKQDFGKVSSGAELVKVSFKENVSVISTHEPAGASKGYTSVEETYMSLVKGSLEERTHVVAEGETFWDIAVKNKMSVEKLLAANPQIVPELLQIGDELNLISPKPMLTVQLIEKAKIQEEMPFEVTYTESKTMYKGDEKVVKPGKNGERVIVANVIRENGVVVGRQVLSQTILENPTTKVVQKGTKAKPTTAPTGKFAKPINRGSFSSDFGIRWGRRHTGVDISTQPGATIYAADGGTVVKAGRYDAYGLCIIIKHGNGYETYYAHLSKVDVKVGDKVYKGQKIGLSGATGRVTGPHLHFEVRRYGIPLDPEKFLKLR